MNAPGTTLNSAPARPDATLDVASAMRAVLDVESAATLDLERCKDACQQALEAARMNARDISVRAESIARGIHGRIERVANARAELRRKGPDDGPGTVADADVAAAIQRLAVRITGGLP